MKTMTLCTVVYALAIAVLFLSQHLSPLAGFVATAAAILWALLMWNEGYEERRRETTPVAVDVRVEDGP